MAIYALDGFEPVIDPTAWVHPDATVIGRVFLGAGASVWPRAVLRGDAGEIRIGARTSVQDGSVLHTTGFHFTVVGADCVVGHLVHLEGCTIGDRSLIGSGSVVLNGATVGEDSLVGAGALVPPGMEVPSDHRALGVPAKLRAGAGIAETVKAAVASYVENAQYHRTRMTRLD